MDHVILNHGQVTWTTPELAPPSPNYHTTPTGGRSALDRFNVHRCSTRRKHIFGGGSKDVQLSYEDYFMRTVFSSTDRVTAEIRETFQQLQNLYTQKYAFQGPEVVLSMDELNLDQAP
ncbi:uncharacterized protein TNCV_3507681 [Trichonephila clavipes]|uniref:Uncharacterized protein n=1 Tax=Trichonephila clavipes TaxID=2585209 RepID=A0A8X6VCI5_TRICX|nr:uncharacterized protein TNCV_3507681 [Trichonephila clavipes]